MKQQILSLVERGLSNPHTSVAGLVWLACKFGPTWFPQYEAQFKATEALAVAYGLFLAGDSGKTVPKPPAPTP